jgi:hypothetical protein
MFAGELDMCGLLPTMPQSEGHCRTTLRLAFPLGERRVANMLR